MMTTNHRHGFTLIELLVTITIMAVTAGSIVAVFAAGIRVWEYIDEAARHEGIPALVGLEMRRDLRNAVSLRDAAACAWTGNHLRFVASARPGTESGLLLQTIEYRLEGDALIKEVMPYPPSGARRTTPPERTPLADGVSDFAVEYEHRRDSQGTYAWSRQTTGFPRRVRIALEFADRERIVRTVLMPGYRPVEER